MANNEETTAMTIQADGGFNAQQIDLIRRQIAPDASRDELALFLEVCRGTSLNPFLRQIHAVFRNVNVNGRWEKRMAIQTGIDGYRLLAARTGQLAGIDDVVFDSEDDTHPNRATVTVYRLVAGQRVPFTATARWREYVQTTKDGNPTSMWAKMPYTMLGKCVEALALRKGFPAELSGVYTHEEMMQADNNSLTPLPELPRKPQQPRAAENVSDVVDAETDEPAPSQQQSTQATAAPASVVDSLALTHASAEDQRRLADALRKHGYTTAAAVEALLADVCKRAIPAAQLSTATSDLSLMEMSRVYQRLTNYTQHNTANAQAEKVAQS